MALTSAGESLRVSRVRVSRVRMKQAEDEAGWDCPHSPNPSWILLGGRDTVV